MKQSANRVTRHTLRRMVSAVLALVLLLGILPVSGMTNAAHWTDEYVNTLVDWGVMRGDISGNMNADKNITRAEFVAMVNRAFGYTADTEHPFEDVQIQDWYNNDIGMGYNMGYFKGVSETEAAPNSSLTREQAVVLIGRNLLLDEKIGETLGFSDSRTFSDWSRGMVESAISAGFIGGYDDGSFKPQQSVTRGEVAAMLVRAIGTMVHTSGTHELGGVYGNVMISTSGVKLKNTTIAGDLYITGGVALGDVMLENVTVLGKIVISGTGESQKGDSSIILRNVEAGELVVNSIADQFVTMRAEGNTQIDFTNVKTSAYLDDQTETGDGLLYIELNGKNGMNVTLAGNIEEVLNCTTGSALVMAQGTAQTVTMDEKATNATLDIKNGATIKKLNLDVATSVSGKGDVEKIFVNAAGSTVEMLPDKITIRPGLSATINGEEMDTQAGQESSSEPRILSGYPKIKNLAPNSVEIVFNANKKGTIYWALTSLIDGPVKAEDLLEVKDYNTKILQQGTITVTDANKDFSTKISNLLADGSYYVSAVLVDSRKQNSPVKYVTFTTPDGSAPAFATGYPELTQIKKDSAQMAVMPTKTSKLYYAVLPKGASAPTIADFKAGAISGDLGNCPTEGIPVTKNVVDVRDITAEGKLTELTSYELYLCLIDADNGKDSGVKHVSFTTIDGTAPELTDGIASAEKTGIKVVTSMNEDGIIYWVAVKEGQEYPVYPSNLPEDATEEEKMKVFQLQVINGAGNVIKSGKSNAKANADVSLNITGLEQETSYDIYYVAQDKAGNCSVVKKLTQRTLDTTAPEVKQSFSKTADAEGNKPHADTDITLMFSETVRTKSSNRSFYELYNDYDDATGEAREKALETLVEVLNEAVQLMDITNAIGSYQVPHTPKESDKDSTKAWIDYSKVKIDIGVSGEMTMTFENGKAINLVSGGVYQFVLNDIMDTSQNAMKPNYYKMDSFETVFAQVNLTSSTPNASLSTRPLLRGDTTQTANADDDIHFWMMPQSTNSVNENIKYDIWFETTDRNVYFDVYCRVLESNGSGGYQAVTDTSKCSMFGKKALDTAGWYYLGNMNISAAGTEGTTRRKGLGSLLGLDTLYSLNTLKQEYTYEFLIDITQIGANTEEKSWSDTVKLNVLIPAGQSLMLNSFNLDKPFTDTNISNVANPDPFSVSAIFIDELTPKFINGKPEFTAGDTSVNMKIQLDRAGTLYYVVAPMEQGATGTYTSTVSTVIKDTSGQVVADWFKDATKASPFPAIDGSGLDAEKPLGNQYTLETPNAEGIIELLRDSHDSGVKTGTQLIGSTLTTVQVKDLQSETRYVVYFLLQGQSQAYSKVHMFQFTTAPVDTPTIKLTGVASNIVEATTSTTAELSWVVFASEAAKKIFGTMYLTENDLNPTANLTQFKEDCKTVDSNETSRMTVLNALIKTPSNSLKSYFDVYASDTLKDKVLKIITGATKTEYDIASSASNIPFEDHQPQNITPGGIGSDATYYIFAAAKNKDGDTYGFKALDNLRKPDTSAPEYRGTQTFTDNMAANIKTPSSYDVLIDTAVEKPRQYVYKGKATITFNEEIYLLEKSGDGLKTDAKKVTNFTNSVIANGLTITNAIISNGTIDFEFEDAQYGATIIIFKSGSICDASQNVREEGGARLKLTYVLGEGTRFLDTLKTMKFEGEWIN